MLAKLDISPKTTKLSVIFFSMETFKYSRTNIQGLYPVFTESGMLFLNKSKTFYDVLRVQIDAFFVNVII